MSDKKYWVAINGCSAIGPARFRRLYNYFSSMQDAWYSTNAEWKKAGLEEKVIYELRRTVETIDPEKEMEKLRSRQIGVVTIREKNFPQNLKKIDRPPAIIYIKGELKKCDEIALAVVGTRRMSYYGQAVTEKISADLARSGVTIVSGLARGVDTIAHRAALENGGRTIGIAGSGLDEYSFYPPENVNLMQKIIEGRGAVISEYHLGVPALREHFPARNRLISALSLGVLVTECPQKSGALLTARAALEQGREVFAVPGDIRSPNSQGAHNLIKIGAKLVTEAQEILEEYNLEPGQNKEAPDLHPETKEEAKLFDFLSIKPISFDFLVKKTKLDSSIVSSTLTMMEIQGKVRNVGMNKYIIKK
ncbi:DNA-processing protein DprA [Patescibacteria group bacterium]|nr:DNA-processing protein DprA [Patescibacteria group bacterium]